jgi:hypothetical protein
MFILDLHVGLTVQKLIHKQEGKQGYIRDLSRCCREHNAADVQCQ